MTKTIKKSASKKLKERKEELKSFETDFNKLGEKKIKKVFKKHEELFREYDSDVSENDDHESLLKLANKIKDSQKDKKKGKKIKKKKSKRKPGKPTKPIPSYFIFNKERHPLTKEKYPEMTPQQIKKKISEIWNAMDDEEKKPYNDKALKEKERYNKELEEYNKNHSGDTTDEDESEPEKKKKKVRDPNRPKKYTTAFFLFCNQKRKELKEQSPESSEKPPDTAKRSSKEWKTMTPEQKKPYTDKEAILKKKYLEDMEVYKKNKLEEENKMKDDDEESE